MIIAFAGPGINILLAIGLLTGLFMLSAALTVVALFTNYVGSFITLLATTVALLMVKKSADEMSSSQQ